MSHYEFSGTLLKCLADIDEQITTKDLGCKTRIVIDVEDGKVEKENLEEYDNRNNEIQQRLYHQRSARRADE